MKIGGIEETSKLKRKVERKEANLKQMRKRKTDGDASKSQADSAESTEYDTGSSDSATVDEYIPDPKSVKTKPKPDRQCQKMRISLLFLAKACDRTGVSDRSAAVLATSVLNDLGLVPPLDRSKVIDRSKIRRESSKTCEKLKQNDDDQFDNTNSGIEGVLSDGRKDKSLTQVLNVDNKYYRKTLTEEHISIIAEPGSSYFSHTTPP